MKKPELVKSGTFATGFGTCRLAISRRGVCFLGFFTAANGVGGTGGDGELETRQRLVKFCRGAKIAEERELIETVGRRIFSRPPTDRLPGDLGLDLAGTPFQLEVWRALRTIPPGRTLSYREVAAAIGRPAAVRAVANAVAANPVAWLVPCHRVIRADGTLGGYRWGPARKAKMLAWERNFGFRAG